MRRNALTDPASARQVYLNADFAMSPADRGRGVCERFSQIAAGNFPVPILPLPDSTPTKARAKHTSGTRTLSENESARCSREGVIDRANQLPAIQLSDSAREETSLGHWLLLEERWPIHSKSLSRLSEFGAGTLNGNGRLTGHQPKLVRMNRHTFCSWLAMAGASIKEILELVGHKTITMSAL